MLGCDLFKLRLFFVRNMKCLLCIFMLLWTFFVNQIDPLERHNSYGCGIVNILKQHYVRCHYMAPEACCLV